MNDIAFHVRFFAWYIVDGKQLSTGKMNLCRRDKKFIQKFIGTTMGSTNVHQDQCG